MSPKLTVSYHPYAKKILEETIKRDDPTAYSNILASINALAKEGLYPGVLPRNKLKKLKGQKKNPNPFWRLREGDWRVVFAIQDNEIKIVWIGRKDDDIYKKFTRHMHGRGHTEPMPSKEQSLPEIMQTVITKYITPYILGQHIH